jgi:hypothetical protein
VAKGIPPIALKGVVHGRNLPGLFLRVRSDDGDLAAELAEVVVRSRHDPARVSNDGRTYRSGDDLATF